MSICTSYLERSERCRQLTRTTGNICIWIIAWISFASPSNVMGISAPYPCIGGMGGARRWDKEVRIRAESGKIFESGSIGGI
jgi:hypothetical protein